MVNTEMGENSNRMQILEMIEKGRITAEEGLHLLQALSDLDNEPAEADDETQSALADERLVQPIDIKPQKLTEIEQGIPLPSATIGSPDSSSDRETEGSAPKAEAVFSSESKPEVMPDQYKWKRWWMIPLWIGVTITVFGGIFMFLAQRSSGVGLWFVCAAVPFTLGLILIVLAWQSRRAPWLHLRVQQPPGEWPEKIAFSFPLPVKPIAWFFRTFGKHIRGLEAQNLDQLIQAVGEETSPDNPISIHVDDPDGGEKVDIYIG